CKLHVRHSPRITPSPVKWWVNLIIQPLENSMRSGRRFVLMVLKIPRSCLRRFWVSIMTFTLHLNGVKLAETTFPVTLTVESEVATVTLDRPEARNAVSLEMCEGLLDVFDQINRRDDIGVVLIR